MAITDIHDDARNAMCNALVDLVDVSAPGDLLFYDSGASNLLATLTFANPAFGNSSAGTATANAIVDDTSCDQTGVCAVVHIRDGGGKILWKGEVGTSNKDINFNTNSWTAGDTISVSSLTVKVPSS